MTFFGEFNNQNITPKETGIWQPISLLIIINENGIMHHGMGYGMLLEIIAHFLSLTEKQKT